MALEGGDGATNFNGNTITISISNDMCNGNSHPLEIAGTLLHESIHASMYYEALLENPNLTKFDYCEIWQIYFETNDPCHEVMANQYVDKLANSLLELDNNDNLSIDHYKYIAWGGLEKVGNDIGLLTDQYATEYYDEYLILINEPIVECQ